MAALFSPDYITARTRFLAAAGSAGASTESLHIHARSPANEELAIDIAWLGSHKASRVLPHVTGMHGVEAFAGAATQLALPAEMAQCGSRTGQQSGLSCCRLVFQGDAGMTCELCDMPGGVVVWRDTRCRVVQVEEPGYPGFCRVIWNSHVKEMTDLAEDDRRHCMDVVFAVEHAIRRTLHPAKVNLAALGNMVAHIHWHVIPRYEDDPHFPQPIWGVRQREGAASRSGLESLTSAIRTALENA